MQQYAEATQGTSLHRKITAVGTIGELGQLFTVYERNWICSDCGQENYASRGRCFRCKHSKPEGDQNYVVDPALQAIQNGEELQWSEAIDPNSYQVYYYNKKTGQTQWERPVELGPAPVATGWFGRGAAGSNATATYAELNKKYLSRPARKQKEFIDPKRSIHEVGTDYNIWYGKYLTDFSEYGVNKDPASDRCHLEKDAGYTRADNIVNRDGTLVTTASNSNRKDRRFFCIHFAHGVCAKGAECTFFHRIPTPEDDAKCDELFDCFGRSRHNKHRDDMNGVGSFMKPCRTLYVGNLLKMKYSSPKELEDTLWRHFSEWGELENCNVIHRLSIAFPRFRYRTSAEFAKEAMSNQALEQSEVLMIRWAFDDPNPVAQDAINRADKDAIASLLVNKGISLEEAPFQYPSEYQLQVNKKFKVDGVSSTDGSNLRIEDIKVQEFMAANPHLLYPSTDSQYSQDISLSTSTDMQSLQYFQECYNGILGSSESTPAVETGVALDDSIPKSSDEIKQSDTPQNTEEQSSSDSAVGRWTEHTDPESGATFYYNETTGESSWFDPNDSGLSGQEAANEVDDTASNTVVNDDKQ